MKGKQGLSKIAEHEGMSLYSITSEVKNYLWFCCWKTNPEPWTDRLGKATKPTKWSKHY